MSAGGQSGPPSADVSLEQAVLDAVLAEPEQLAAVRAVLDPRAFYRQQHRAIYRAALDLDDAGEPVDVLTVEAALSRAGPPKHGQTWAATLAGLVGSAPVWANALRYAVRIAELGHQRRVAVALGVLR